MKRFFPQKLVEITIALICVCGLYSTNVQAQNISGTVTYTDVYHGSTTTTKPTGCQKDSDTECMPYCKYQKVEECLLCPVFAVVFNTASTIGAVAITTFSNSVVRVVVVAFGIWLAIQILLLLLTFLVHYTLG